MKELWKPINGYEDRYHVSNLGRVKSIKRISEQDHLLPERILRPGNLRGYHRVLLLKNGHRKNVQVHRLVAKAFIPNPKNKPQVNHINGVKNDNRVDNLEWVTASENKQHAFDTGLEKPQWSGVCGKDNPLSRQVIQVNLSTGYQNKFDGINEASRIIGIDCGSIVHCLKGRRKSAGGFKWMYEAVQKKRNFTSAYYRKVQNQLI